MRSSSVVYVVVAAWGSLFAQQAPPLVFVESGNGHLFGDGDIDLGGQSYSFPCSSTNSTAGASFFSITRTNGPASSVAVHQVIMTGFGLTTIEPTSVSVYVRGPVGTSFHIENSYSNDAIASLTSSLSLPSRAIAITFLTGDPRFLDAEIDDMAGTDHKTNSGTNSADGLTQGPTLFCFGTTYSFATAFPISSQAQVDGVGSGPRPPIGVAQATENSTITGHIVRSGQQPPVAAIVAPKMVAVQTPASLDGSQSHDPDGSIIAYRWDIANSSGGIDTLFASTIQYTWLKAGMYNVTLTVTDNEGQTGTADTIVTVTNGTYSCPGGTQILNVGLPAVTASILSAKGAQLNYKGLGLDFTELGSNGSGVLCAAQSNSGSLSITLTLPLTGETFPFAQSITNATVTMFDQSAVGALTPCNFPGGVTNNCLLNGTSVNADSYYGSWQSPGFVTTLVGQTTPFNTGPLTYWIDLSALGISNTTPFDSVLRLVEPLVHTTLITNLPFMAWYSDIAYAIIQDPGVVSLLVVDGAGAGIGYLPSTGTFKSDLPFAYYATSSTNPTIIIFGDTSSGFQITLTGRGTGSYSLAATTGIQGTVAPSQMTQGTLSVGQSQVFQFSAHPTGATLNVVAAGDVNGDGQFSCGDLSIIRGAFGKKTSLPGVDPRADVNLDGIVDVRDLAYVSQKLPVGTRCP